MKNIVLISLLAIVIFCTSFLVKDTYYIYIKPKDPLFQKMLHSKGGVAYYLCNCYARENNPEFTFRDTSKSYTKRRLPSKTYSMPEFVKIANSMRFQHKNNELWFSEIYIVESVGHHKYHYYQVQFYPIDNDE